MLKAEGRLRQSPLCAFQEIEGRVVVVHPRARTVHELNDVGSFLWSLLENPRTIGDLVKGVTEEFDVDEGTVVEDVESFTKELRKQNLLETA